MGDALNLGDGRFRMGPARFGGHTELVERVPVVMSRGISNSVPFISS